MKAAIEKRLRDEYVGDRSFLIRIRVELEWDKPAFGRLIAAMEACCSASEEEDRLPRWQAEVFWYLSTFVRDWTMHPSFPRPEPPEYHEAALRRLDDLAYWFFIGESPYQAGTGFEPL